MAPHTARNVLGLCLALLAGAAFAQGTLGTTAVGTTSYPTSGYEVVSSATCAEWSSERVSVLDPTNNVMYITPSWGSSTPNTLTKVPLPVGSGAVQTVMLNLMDGVTLGLAVDPAGGYLYIASSNVVSVYAINGKGEQPTRIGSLDPAMGDNGPNSITVNPANGDLYVGTNATPPRAASIVKYRRGTGGGLPTRIGSMSMNSGENLVMDGFIDDAGGYGVFVASALGGTSDAKRLVKVSLGAGNAPPQRSGASTWETTAAVGGLVGHAGSDTCYLSHSPRVSWQYNKAEVVKFDVSGSDPINTGTYTSSDSILSTPVTQVLGTDPSGEHVFYIAKPTLGGLLFRKIETSGMTALDSIFENGPFGEYKLGELNPTTGRAYVPFCRPLDYTTNMPHSILEIDSGAGASPPVEVSFQTLPAVFTQIESIAVDQETGHAFLGGNTPSQQYFAKVGYFPGTTKPPEFSSTFWQESSISDPASFAFDPIRRKLYRSYVSKAGFASNLRLERFEPGAGGNAPTLIASMSVSAPSGTIVTYDFDKNEAFFGLTSLTKVRLGVGSEAPEVISATGAAGSYGSLRSMTLDPIHRKVYAGCVGTSVQVAKISLPEGAAPPTIDGTLTTTSGEEISGFIALDPADGYGVTWQNTPRGRILRFSVDGTTNAPVITGTYDFPQLKSIPESTNPISAYLDTDADALYLVAGFRVHRIDTGGATGTMTYQGATIIEDGTTNLNSIVPSGPDEVLVSTRWYRPTRLIKLAKVQPSMKNRLRAIPVVPATRTKVDDIRFYSHAAKGKLRFVIYSSFRNTVWTSPEIVNNVSNGEIVVPISSGTPPEVALDGGTPYFLGFVSDSDTPVASFVSNTGNALALKVAPLTAPKIVYTGPIPYMVPENWSIYATTSIANGLDSIQVFDGDGANAPVVGYTNQRDVLVVTRFNGPTPEMLEITHDNFATSTILPYAQTLPYLLPDVSAGVFTIRARGISASGTTNEGRYTVTVDKFPPSVSMVSWPNRTGATSEPTTLILISTNELLNHPPNTANPNEVELTNCSAGPLTVTNSQNFEFTITHLTNGPVQVRIPINGMSDRAGNPAAAERKVSFTYDTIPPDVRFTLPLVGVGTPTIEGTYTISDASPLGSTLRVYTRKLGEPWIDEFISILPGNVFRLTPGSGVAGTYEFVLRAVDTAGNANIPVPTFSTVIGAKLMHYNPTPNAAVTSPVAGSGSYFFAMENDVLVRIDLSNVSGSGTLTVSREEGDLGPFAGTGQMLHERLNVAYAGFTFGDATLETSYEDENLGGLHESSIVTAARVRGASEPTFFPITHDPSWNRITVSGITNLRDSWYFGRVPSPAANWAMYE